MDPPGQWLEALANNENTHKRKEDSLGMAGKTGGVGGSFTGYPWGFLNYNNTES